MSLTPTFSTSADAQIDSQAVSGTQVNPQDSTDTQPVVCQQNKQHFSDVYPLTPTNVFAPQNSPNNTIYPPTYDYSMPPSHVYPPGNDFGYSFPSRYTHQPNIRCSPTSNYVFPPPSKPYPYCSPAHNPYLPPYDAYSPQYSHLSPSSAVELMMPLMSLTIHLQCCPQIII